MFKCLIRCDSSQDIGHGHLVRCLSLANKLVKKKGWAIEFAVTFCDYSSIKKISQQGFKVNQPVKIPVNSKEEGLSDTSYTCHILMKGAWIGAIDDIPDFWDSDTKAPRLSGSSSDSIYAGGYSTT